MATELRIFCNHLWSILSWNSGILLMVAWCWIKVTAWQVLYLHDFHIIWCSCHSTVARHVPLVKKEFLPLSEHMSSPRVFVCLGLLNIYFDVCCFVDHCLFTNFCCWSFYCPSIYGFWLALWYLQTFLIDNDNGKFRFSLPKRLGKTLVSQIQSKWSSVPETQNFISILTLRVLH